MSAITINNLKASYVNVFVPKAPFNNPNGAPRYSVTLLMPKSDLAGKAALDAAIAAATQEGISSKWGGSAPAVVANPVHDGDGVRPNGERFGPECAGMWVFTANANVEHPPFVVDQRVQPIMDKTAVYSGMWCNVSVSFFAYNNGGKRGVGCGLNGLQKVRDDTPLAGGVTAQQAFTAVAEQAPAVDPWGAGNPWA